MLTYILKVRISVKKCVIIGFGWIQSKNMCIFNEQTLFSLLQFYLSFLDIGVVCKLIHVWSPSGKNKNLARLCMSEKLSRKEALGKVKCSLKTLFEKELEVNFRKMFLECMQKIVLESKPTSTSTNLKDGVRCLVDVMNFNVLVVDDTWMGNFISYFCAINGNDKNHQDKTKEETECSRILLEHSHEYFKKIKGLSLENKKIKALPLEKLHTTYERICLLAQIVNLTYFTYTKKQRLKETDDFQDKELKTLLSLESISKQNYYAFDKSAEVGSLVFNCAKSFNDYIKTRKIEGLSYIRKSDYEKFLWSVCYY